MKKNIIGILLIALMATFVSCDKAEVPNINNSGSDTTISCVTPDFPELTTHFKRVMLEDYTGHTCINCPAAAKLAHDLIIKYQDTLIVVAVHAGYFAKPNNNMPYDFRTAAGDEYNEVFKIASNPIGIVNRKNFTTNQHLVPSSKWAETVNNSVGEAPEIELQIIANYKDPNDELCIHTKTTFLQQISNRALNLTVFILEDGIIQPQQNSDPESGPTPTITDYEHNHVLRGAVNGTWGSPLLFKDQTSGDPIIKSYPMRLKEINKNPINPKKCSIVAFVSDLDTKEILQVSTCKVVE